MHPFLEKLNSTENFVVMDPYNPLSEGPKLTAGVLMSTPDCVTTPTVLQSTNQYIRETGKCQLYAVFRLGQMATGHGGIVHGGLLATLLDESLCRCGFTLLPHQVGVTASLNLTYMAPTPADSLLLLKAETDRVEGRKVWVKGYTYVLPEEFAGELEELTATMGAELLTIEPRWYEKLLEGPAVRAELQRSQQSAQREEQSAE